MGGICQQTQVTAIKSLQQDKFLDLPTYQILEPDEQVELRQKLNNLIQKYPEQKNQLKDINLIKNRRNNYFYYGNLQNNQPQGFGVQYKKDQYLYVGNFDKFPHGKGYYQNYKQNYIFQGQVYKGFMQGKAKITSNDKLFDFQGIINKNTGIKSGTIKISNNIYPEKSYTVILNNYPQQPARIQYRDGRVYEGEIDKQKFVPSGNGKVTFSSGAQIYEGQWKNGRYHGKGKYTWINGGTYEGGYVNGKKQGYGQFTHLSGKVYKGNWLNGHQDGQGQELSKQGNVIKQGKWFLGKYSQQQQHS